MGERGYLVPSWPTCKIFLLSYFFSPFSVLVAYAILYCVGIQARPGESSAQKQSWAFWQERDSVWAGSWLGLGEAIRKAEMGNIKCSLYRFCAAAAARTSTHTLLLIDMHVLRTCTGESTEVMEQVENIGVYGTIYICTAFTSLIQEQVIGPARNQRQVVREANLPHHISRGIFFFTFSQFIQALYTATSKSPPSMCENTRQGRRKHRTEKTELERAKDRRQQRATSEGLLPLKMVLLDGAEEDVGEGGEGEG